MPETLTDLLYSASLSAMHACYVCWLTFYVARGQGPEVRTIFAFG